MLAIECRRRRTSCVYWETCRVPASSPGPGAAVTDEPANAVGLWVIDQPGLADDSACFVAGESVGCVRRSVSGLLGKPVGGGVMRPRPTIRFRRALYLGRIHRSVPFPPRPG